MLQISACFFSHQTCLSCLSSCNSKLFYASNILVSENLGKSLWLSIVVMHGLYIDVFERTYVKKFFGVLFVFKIVKQNKNKSSRLTTMFEIAKTRTKIRLLYNPTHNVVVGQVESHLSHSQVRANARCILVLQHLVSMNLTHWGRAKMAAISQTTLSVAFSWMKMLEFR